MIKMTKALLLFSGGLDSCLAAKVLQKKGIKVYGIYFISPFFGKDVSKLAKQLKLPLKVTKLKQSYIKMLKKPKHGYGKNINPCIDCKIFMLKQAKKYMKQIKAKFIVTGEVLGERPMSQNLTALMKIEKEAGLKNQILRPLSAKLLPKTIAEKYIKKSKLLSIQGRQRTPQLNLAKKYKLKDYQTPSGGCLLTKTPYANKLKDLFKNQKEITTKDCELLRLGRHFRYKNNKIIVGRNEKENKIISKHKGILLEPKAIPGPTTLLLGKNIKLAAQLTVSHTKAKGKTKVKYNKKTIEVKPLTKKQIDKLRI